MSLHPVSNNFNGGELSPLVYDRVDLQKYSTSAKTLENFRPKKYGPIERERGFECVFDSAGTPAVVETKGNAACRLEPFRFNTSTNYVLAFTDLAMRVYKGGATASQIESSPGTAYEVATTYLEADLFDLQFRQINDVMYVTHPSYPVRKISRVSETSWTIADVDWDFPQTLDANDSTTTMTSSVTAVGASGTLTASTSYFDDDMVGGYFTVTHRRDGFEEEEAIDGAAAGSAVKVKGAWSFITVGTWTATVALQRRISSADPWATIKEITSNNDANYSLSGNETAEGVEYRINVTAWTSWGSDAYARLQVDGVDITGVLYLDAVNTTGTIMDVTVKKAVESTDATTMWSEGAFSDHRGHPRTCTFHQQRLWFASTSNDKQRIWASQVGDFENFETGANDDEAIDITLASDQQNEIMWMRSQRLILLGTSANEWTIGADSLNGAITPSNITARVHTLEGSSTLPAILAGSKALFLTRNEKRLQDFFFNFQVDGYDSDEISKLSEHITGDGIVQMAYQQIPDQIVWMARDDGQLVGLVYNQEDNVLAFFRRQNSEVEFESVATIYGDPEDELWVVAKATLDGTTKRLICRLSSATETKEDMVYLDLADTQTGAASNTWTFPHLANETVDVLADGWVAQGLTADGSGVITLPNSLTAAKITAGKPYTSTYRSLNIEAGTGDGSSKGKKKRVHRIDLGVRNSLGGKYGIISAGTVTSDDITSTFPILTRIVGQSTLGNSPDLYTGILQLTMPEGHNEEVDLVVKQEQPLPLTITGTFPVINTKGD